MRLFWFLRHRKVDAMLDAARELPVIQEKPILTEEKELVFTGIDKHFLETVGIKE